MTTNTINTASPVMQEIRNEDLLRWVGVLMAIVGIGISLYLSYVKLADTEVVCSTSGALDCHSVQDSAYASLLGVPIAFLGLAGYGAILGILLLSSRIELFEAYGPALLFSITLFGFMYSMFLTYVEGFILEKWCQWCIASAMLMTGLFVMSGVQLLRNLQIEGDDVFEG